jgi:hypothetical protein
MFDACDEDDYFGPETPRSSTLDLNQSARPSARRLHTTPARLPAFAPSATLSPFGDKDDRGPASSRPVSTLDPYEREYGWGSNSAAIRAQNEYEQKVKERESARGAHKRSKSLSERMFGAGRRRPLEEESTGGGWVGTLVRTVSLGSRKRRPRTTESQVPPVPRRGAFGLCPERMRYSTDQRSH